MKFMSIGEIEKHLQSKYNLNSREAKDAVEEARQLVESQKALIKEYVQNLKDKISVIEKKLKKDNLRELTRKGLESKLEKRQKKLEISEKDIKIILYLRLYLERKRT